MSGRHHFTMRRLRDGTGVFVWGLLCLWTGFVTAADKITVYAAASTTNAVRDIIALYEKAQPGMEVKTSFAASSALAKQIEQGAPAQVYISADNDWMDYLEKKDLLEPGTRRPLLANALVLIAPRSSRLKVEMDTGFDLAGALGEGRLCMANPDAVPAGKYGKKALISMGWWSKVVKSVVPAEDVRAALAFVEREECAAGIVYSTDARISDKVRVVATFPKGTYPDIEYPVGLIKPAGDAAAGFLEFLGSDAARAVFEKYGFVAP